MKKILFVFIILGMLVPTVFYLKKKFFLSEEEKIKRVLNTAADAAMKKDHGNFMRQFSFEFRTEHGLTWATVTFFIKNAFKKYDSIRVSLRGTQIEVHENDADVRFIAMVNLMTGRGEMIRESARLDMKMKKESGNWKIIYLKESDYDFY
jgi:hypothetical protein